MINRYSNSIPHVPLASTSLNSQNLDDQLISAFQALDFKKATSLVERGANPNQMINLTHEVMKRYLEVTAPLFKGELSFRSEQDVQIFILEFFDGEFSHPALFMSTILKEIELSIALLKNGANLTFEFFGEEGFKINILQVACSINCTELAVYAIVHHRLKICEPVIEGDLSPLAIAILSGYIDLVKILIQLCPEEIDPHFFEEPLILDALQESGRFEEIQQLIESYGKEIGAR